MKERRFVHRRDVLVVGAILLLGVLFVLLANSGEKGMYAEILKENTVIKRVDLSIDETFSPEGYPNVVFRVENGRIAFVKSDCPDKICVGTGFIGNKGQSAVCLPNRLTLRIVGQNDKEDTIAG